MSCYNTHELIGQGICEQSHIFTEEGVALVISGVHVKADEAPDPVVHDLVVLRTVSKQDGRRASTIAPLKKERSNCLNF